MHDVFFFTDIHGMGCLYDKIMDYCLKKDSECTIIFGGDACDRGPDGYRIMQELLDNPRVVYIKGNHEDMFIRAALATIKLEEGRDVLSLDEVTHYIYNGGWPTFKAWLNDGKPTEIIAQLQDLPLCASYENIDFCHAGGQYKVFKRIEDAYYHDQPLNEEDVAHILWDRNCFCFGWTPGRICVHGHTPTFELPKKYYGLNKSPKDAHPCTYLGNIDERLTGKKIDMDTFSCGTGRAYVLDCLTFEAIGFMDYDHSLDEIRNHDVEQFEVIQM